MIFLIFFIWQKKKMNSDAWFIKIHKTTIDLDLSNGTKYSRMDQLKFVEYSH